MSVGKAELPPPWFDLASAGFKVRVDHGVGRIRIPIDRFNLLFLLVIGAVLALIVGGVALLIGLGLRWAAWLALAVLAAALVLALGRRRSWMAFDLVLDLDSGELLIPTHTSVMRYGGRLNAHEVVSAGVDWARGHGERAPADAPITYFSMSLPDGDVLTDATLNMGRLDAARARALVVWFYRYVIPQAEHGSVDPEP